MEKPIAVVKKIYEAFQKADTSAILQRVAQQVDWEFVSSPKVPYSGRRKGLSAVAQFFIDVGRTEDIIIFEPREFIEAGEHVIVLGFKRVKAKDTGRVFESEWAHIFTVQDEKVIRCRGFFDTAARFF